MATGVTLGIAKPASQSQKPSESLRPSSRNKNPGSQWGVSSLMSAVSQVRRDSAASLSDPKARPHSLAPPKREARDRGEPSRYPQKKDKDTLALSLTALTSLHHAKPDQAATGQRRRGPSDGASTDPSAVAAEKPKERRRDPGDRSGVIVRSEGDLSSELDKSEFGALLAEGHIAMEENHPDKAEEFFQRANKLKPQNLELVLAFGQALLKQKKFSEAEAHYGKFEKLALTVGTTPTKAQFHLAFGIASRGSSHHTEALDHFKKAELLDPDNVVILAYLGVTYAEDEKFPTAYNYFMKLQKRPLEPEVAKLVEESAFETAEFFGKLQRRMTDVSVDYEPAAPELVEKDDKKSGDGKKA